MKNLFLLVALSVLIAGCITSDRARLICPRLESLTEQMVLRILASDPDNKSLREGVGSAAVVLTQAAADPTLSFDDLAIIITKLPVEKLQDQEIRMYIEAGQLFIILIFPDGLEVDVSKHESAQIVAGCLAAGMQRGLALASPTPAVIPDITPTP